MKVLDRFSFLFLLLFLTATPLEAFGPVLFVLLQRSAQAEDIESKKAEAEPYQVLSKYLKAFYARDYKEAYLHISDQDRRLKDEKTYLRERGAFSGFTLEVAKKVANYIEISPVERRMTSDRAQFKVRIKLPDANKLSPMLLNWDSDRLEALSAGQRDEIIESLEKLRKTGKPEMIEGEESFDLVKEAGAWKIFLNWAAGINLKFQTTIPSRAPIEIKLLQSEVVTKPGELFSISFKIRNNSKEGRTARIRHVVDPRQVREHLDLVECGFLYPVRLFPGQEEQFISTYLLRGGLPENVRQLTVTYAVTLQH
jgi:hypothetical protein